MIRFLEIILIIPQKFWQILLLFLKMYFYFPHQSQFCQVVWADEGGEESSVPEDFDVSQVVSNSSLQARLDNVRDPKRARINSKACYCLEVRDYNGFHSIAILKLFQFLASSLFACSSHNNCGLRSQ